MCVGSKCQLQTLASGVYKPAAITVGSNYAFFIDGNGAVEKLAKTGGTPAILLPASDGVSQFQAVGAQLFWSKGESGAVGAINDDGTGAATVLTGQSAWTVANGNLYWFNPSAGTCTCPFEGEEGTISCTNSIIDCQGTCTCTADTGTLMTGTLAGTGARQIIGALKTQTAIWVNATAAFGAYSWQGTNCAEPTIVARLPLDGSPSESLGSVQLGAGLGIDARDIYFFGLTISGCGSGADLVMRQLLTGGTWGGFGITTSVNLFATGSSLDYYAYAGGPLSAFDPTLSAPTATSIYANGVNGIATNAGFVYFTDLTNGAVLRIGQ
jgi:hypothetical protein